MKSWLPLSLLLVPLAGCSLLDLRSDLASIEQGYRRGSAELAYEGSRPAVLVVFSRDSSATIESFDVARSAGTIELLLPAKPLSVFAFVDDDGDMAYHEGDACASMQIDPGNTAPGEETQLELRLPDAGCSSRDAPPQMSGGSALQWTEAAALRASFGDVTTLDDERFSPQQATAGLWQPLEFVKAEAAGLFMLQPYDATRVPVLFVHGMVGTPRDFRHLIERLDTGRYQPWVLSYPSGVALQEIARSMQRILARARYKFRFDELHIVAHSMGGVVVRGFLNECVRTADCAYLRSFTSIASPFGGDPAAEFGSEHAPVVAPVWRDMAPGSEYLRSLFQTPLPDSLPHNLLFAFHHEGMGNTSSDGTVDVSSQLRPEAQQQAVQVRGYDETHMSVLNSDAVVQELSDVLERPSARRRLASSRAAPPP
jgi:hypothetical protein